MKQFLWRVAAFAMVFFLIDKGFILLRDAAPEREVDRRLEAIITGKVDAEIVILGSSRGARSLIAGQISDATGQRALNLSYPGSNVVFHEFLLRQLTETKGNTLPKTVILAVDDGSQLSTAPSLTFRFDRLYPLVKYQTIRDEMVRRREKLPIVNECLILHQMNKSNFLLRQKKFTRNDVILPCGSMPIDHQKDSFNKRFIEEAKTYHRGSEVPEKAAAFHEIVRRCRDLGIQLIIAIPPNFNITSEGFKERMEELVGDSGTVWMFDDSKAEYRDEKNFFDHAHLRTIGAAFFTTDFIEFYQTLQSSR